MAMKRGKAYLLALAVAAAGAMAGWGLLASEPPATTPALAKVEIADVAQTVLATGMLEATELVSVGARTSGQIENLAVVLGQQVKSGDLIAQIDSQDQQNTVLQAEASLAEITAQIAAKKAQLDLSEQTLSRQQKLSAQNHAADETVDTAAADVAIYTAELDALTAQEASAEVTLATARTALERTKITAPTDGTIVAVVVKQGQTVNAAQSAPTIVKIADLSTMVVKVEISEADVMSVAPGQSASFTTLGAPDESFDAVVSEIEPAPTEIADSDTLSSDSAMYYNGLLKVDNADGRLRIGMSAEVSIELARADDVLTVPSSALKSDQDGQYVEVFDTSAQQTQRRAVDVGLNDKITAEIRDGLTEGALVVTGAQVATAPSNQQGGMRPPPMF
ncbi:MAG: efflux RND transporter periplasmic adaptor subunit [Paracoccus denitrificans]|uniref:Efflux RND transporter periplasmic adaptor subunit n=1 Tax=Paracoccus denitrificans TaxID=266 RepID=A0A533IC51_PARDE|nr:MAG: efflux RND transporter periplasmic adaptor subunit [Paracoccus denitrificans]